MTNNTLFLLAIQNLDPTGIPEYLPTSLYEDVRDAIDFILKDIEKIKLESETDPDFTLEICKVISDIPNKEFSIYFDDGSESHYVIEELAIHSSSKK